MIGAKHVSYPILFISKSRADLLGLGANPYLRMVSSTRPLTRFILNAGRPSKNSDTSVKSVIDLSQYSDGTRETGPDSRRLKSARRVQRSRAFVRLVSWICASYLTPCEDDDADRQRVWSTYTSPRCSIGKEESSSYHRYQQTLAFPIMRMKYKLTSQNITSKTLKRKWQIHPMVRRSIRK